MPEPITYTEQPSDVLAHAAGLATAGRRFALITSVEIMGGSSRELGALAVVEDTGAMIGYLSNGCIDRDIQMQATAALANGARRVLHYGQGSPYLDLALPCGGALKALVDPSPDVAAIHAAHASLAARHPARLRFTLPAEAGSGLHVFDYAPKFRLVMAGRGAVFCATARAAHAAGFEVEALSPEAEDLETVTPLTHTAPHRLTVPDNAPALDMLDRHSAFLTLFHDHDWEPALLERALRTEAGFIGSLGSKRSHSLRLLNLRARGVAEAELARLHGPIGLVPSLRDAQLIAVSALAEVVSHLPRTIAQAEQAA